MTHEELKQWCEKRNIFFAYTFSINGELLAEMPDGFIYRRSYQGVGGETPAYEIEEFKKCLEEYGLRQVEDNKDH